MNTTLLTTIIIVVIAGIIYIANRGITFRLSIPVKSWLLSIWEDIKLVVSSVGRKSIIEQNQHEHFGYSFAIACACVGIGFFIKTTQFKTSPWWALCILFTLALFTLNCAREGYKQFAGGKDNTGQWIVPFSWRDVRFGAYGGGLGAVAGLAIVLLITNYILS